MELEEYRGFYIQRQTIADAKGRITEYFDIGHVIEVEGVKRYKVSSSAGFSTRAAAIEYIDKQTR